jgi:hypothetical protein
LYTLHLFLSAPGIHLQAISRGGEGGRGGGRESELCGGEGHPNLKEGATLFLFFARSIVCCVARRVQLTSSPTSAPGPRARAPAPAARPAALASTSSSVGCARAMCELFLPQKARVSKTRVPRHTGRPDLPQNQMQRMFHLTHSHKHARSRHRRGVMLRRVCIH